MSSVIKATSVTCKDAVCTLPLVNSTGQKTVHGTVKTSEKPDPERLLRQAEQALAAARDEQDKLLAQTKQMQAELLKKTRAECDELRLLAREEGFESGRQEGLTAATLAGEELRAQARQLLEDTHAIRAEMLRRVEPQLVQLSISIASRLLQQELQLHPDSIMSIVHGALMHLQEAGEVILRLHPDDLTVCRDVIPQWQGQLREKTVLTALADHAMERGRCRIEAGSSILECCLEERLAKLKELLMDVASYA